MISNDWKTGYDREIDKANSARLSGNEGMARVCARRAAAIIIGEYLTRRGYRNFSNSMYDRISILNSLPDVDNQCKHIAYHFLVKVNPDHNLPIEADLLREVEWLADTLLMNNPD